MRDNNGYIMTYQDSQRFLNELRNIKTGGKKVLYKGLTILDVRRMHSIDRRFILKGKSIGVHNAIKHLSKWAV